MSHQQIAPDKPDNYSRAVHWLAMLLTGTVFPLIWVGGLVTTYDAGMAVPDWPATYGYNMFAYPATTWIFGPFDLLVEHSHRLLGSMAGLLAIGLVFCAFRFQRRRGYLAWSALVLLMVISQGILGGVRVLLDARTVAMIHGCVGPLVFVLATAAAVMSSRWWLRQIGATTPGGSTQKGGSTAQGSKPAIEVRDSVAGVEDAGGAVGLTVSSGGLGAVSQAEWRPGRGLIGLAAAVVLFSYLQLIVGAQLRHVTGNTSPSLFTGFVHMHLTLAAVVLSLAILFAACTLWRSKLSGRVRWPSGILLLLVCVQIALGTGTWIVNYALPWQEVNDLLAAYTIQAKGLVESMIVTAHMATGSLILSVATVAGLRTWVVAR